MLNMAACFSDDDLEPYDMTHDTTTEAVKPPKYIRDCMEGMLHVAIKLFISCMVNDKILDQNLVSLNIYKMIFDILVKF